MARNQVITGLAGFFGDVGRARQAADTYAELTNLTDAGLKARGLNRAQLPAHAFNTAFGRK